MKLIFEMVAEKFEVFEKTQQPAIIQEALSIVENIERDESGENINTNQRFSFWLFFFENMDRYIDLNWDQKRLPIKGIPPPASHKGIVYPSGEVDPSSISDPVERANYVEALNSIKNYTAWYNTQFQLHRIDERAMADFKRILISSYGNSFVNKQELEGLLFSSKINNIRKQKLNELITEIVV